jgi:membrane protein YdbS with pleckstrin-like domain
MNEYLELILTFLHVWAGAAVLILAFVTVWIAIPYFIEFARWMEGINEDEE